jgi:integrase
MSAAAESDLLAYHALGLFAGIRPKELQRLQWDDIDLAEGHIMIRAGIAKNHRRRIIDIESNLAVWLRACKRDGAVTPAKNLRARLEKIRWSAFVTLYGGAEKIRTLGVSGRAILPSKQDVMPHSYASYWLASHGDINKLTLMMGHATTTMLWKHYHKAAKKTEADSGVGRQSK